MKKLLLISAILLSSLANAQKIHFTDTTNVWKQYVSFYNDGHGDPHYYTHVFDRDTLIAGLKYRHFNFIWPTVLGNESWIREDTVVKKVYIKDFTHDSDVILMDYNLSVGDTFTAVYDSVQHCYYKFLVQNIDSTLINGVWHRAWHFLPLAMTCGAWSSVDVVEGIGCIQHPLFMIEPKGIEPPWERMYCFSNNGTTPPLSPAIQHLDNTTSCATFPHLSAPELTQHNTLKIYPNPANTTITVAGNKLEHIIIFNLVGQIIYNQPADKEKIEIDISNLSTGVYFIKVNGTEIRRFIKQ